MSLSPLQTPDGMVVTSAIRDITERKQAELSLRELSGRLLQMQDEERRHIARELHDSAGQIIAAVNMMNPLADRPPTSDSGEIIQESLGLLSELSTEIRTISHLLHPPLLDEVGLSSALRLYLEGFVDRSKISVDLEIPNDFGRLSRDLETTVFRVVQECLTNIHRHSGSSVARVLISIADHNLHVEVQDEGKGIPPRKRVEIERLGRAGVGIRGMRERIHQLGGTLQIGAQTNGKGTIVVARLPLDKGSDQQAT